MSDVIRVPGASTPDDATRSTRLTAASRAALFRRWWARRGTFGVSLSLFTLLALVLIVIFADTVSPHVPTDINLRNRLAPPAFMEGGSWEHPLGTDATGRDILSRIAHGGRVSLFVGGVSTALGLLIGTVLGLVSGYQRGWADEFIMYLVDVQLSLPFILLAIALALVLGTSLTVLVWLAALAIWPIFARVVRGAVLSLREREFVIAAQALGGHPTHIIRQHLLPNIVGPIFVLTTLSIGRVILLESGLSFIGVGIKPPTPTWGGMINDGRDYLSSAWWLATMPGVVLMILTMAIGTLGDWMRDLSDTTLD